MLFGFTLPVNFRNPLASANPQDFWRRWHISLSGMAARCGVHADLQGAQQDGVFRPPPAGRAESAFSPPLLAMGVWNGLALHYVVSGLMFGA